MSEDSPSRLFFLVTAGTYDGWFCGWIWEPATKSLQERFGVTDHAGPITAVTATKRWVLSGGTDETIRVYKAKALKGFGIMDNHKETVTCMKFGTSFLASGDRSGHVVCNEVTQYFFNEVSTIKVHRGIVNGCDVQPGKAPIVLSVGSDKFMRLTNFRSKRILQSRRFPDEPIACCYTSFGDTYIIAFEKRVVAYDATDQSDTPKMQYISKDTIHAMALLEDWLLVIGCDNKEVRVLEVATGNVLCSEAFHTNRVKGVGAQPNGDGTYSVASIDSNGKLVLSTLFCGPVPDSKASRRKKRKRSETTEEESAKRQRVMWQRELKGTFVPYAGDLSDLIEEAYQKGEKSFELPNTAPARYVLDFAQMKQTNHTAKPKRARPIQRCVFTDEKEPTAEKESGESTDNSWKLVPAKSITVDLRFTCLAMAIHIPPKPHQKGNKNNNNNNNNKTKKRWYKH